MSTDGFCLGRAILLQIVHHPDFTPEMANRMAGLHMVRNPHKFYKLIEFELQKTGESYESYCYNVFHSKVWGDDLIAAVFVDMWNLAISIVSPLFNSRIDLFHTKDEPDVVIIANGGSYMAQTNSSTHFSGTRNISEGYRKPGLDLVNTKPGIGADVVYKKLFPIVLDDVVKAKRLAVEEYVKGEKKKSLEYLYVMNKQIVRCENEVARSIRELEKMRSERKKFEFQMEQLGISVEKIKATRIHKELPYMLTDEAERELISQERKRKREEEEEELQRKRSKVVETKDDEVVDDKDVTEEESKDKEHDKTLIEQLQSMIKTQENLVQQQERALIESNLRIKQLELEKANPMVNTGQIITTVPGITSFSDFDDISLQTLDPSIVDITQSDTSLQLQPQPQTSSGITSVRKPGPWSLQNLIKPEHMKFLAPIKREPVATGESQTRFGVANSSFSCRRVCRGKSTTCRNG